MKKDGGNSFGKVASVKQERWKISDLRPAEYEAFAAWR